MGRYITEIAFNKQGVHVYEDMHIMPVFPVNNHLFIYSVFQRPNKLDIEHVIKITVGTVKSES
jgi:hypothetical protein